MPIVPPGRPVVTLSVPTVLPEGVLAATEVLLSRIFGKGLVRAVDPTLVALVIGPK